MHGCRGMLILSRPPEANHKFHEVKSLRNPSGNLNRNLNQRRSINIIHGFNKKDLYLKIDLCLKADLYLKAYM